MPGRGEGQPSAPWNLHPGTLMRFDIVTLFPEFFRGPFDYGVVARALSTGLAEARIHDLRAFTHDRHRTVDDRPFGGGEGMVLKPQPIFECIEFLAQDSLGLAPKSIREAAREAGRATGEEPSPASSPADDLVILLSAQGRRFTQPIARRLARARRVVLICGRYEGVDERVSQLLCDEELSIGDYVLSGGELAAAVVVDAVVRLLPGVLGHADSSRYESFGEPDPPPSHPTQPRVHENPDPHENPAPHENPGAPGLDSQTWVSPEAPATSTPTTVPRSTHAAGGLLDYPHYTRPAQFHGVQIPAPLLSGDHLAIRRWRRQAALAKTLANRPDLLDSALLSDNDRAFLATLGYTPSVNV
jgi:tRNA (guanine37-N1)-methyltransferase